LKQPEAPIRSAENEAEVKEMLPFLHFGLNEGGSASHIISWIRLRGNEWTLRPSTALWKAIEEIFFPASGRGVTG
jgi:hypothetical protein